MSELEDIKLKALLNELQLDSPDPSFTLQVMDRIHKEKELREVVKKDKLFGKGFWLILVLFVILMTSYFVLSTISVAGSEPADGVMQDLGNTVSGGIQGFLSGFAAIPLSVAGIMLAGSLLLFIDRLVTSNTGIFRSL